MPRGGNLLSYRPSSALASLQTYPSKHRDKKEPYKYVYPCGDMTSYLNVARAEPSLFSNGVNTATGWLEELAFGLQIDTVGGLSKTTYASSNWNNQMFDVSAGGGTFATQGLNGMAELMLQTQIFAPEGSVDLILASPTSYRRYKNTLQAQERYMPKETVLDAGRLALAYNGALMYVENNLGNLVGGGITPSMYFLNTKSMKVVFDSDANFSMTDFEHKSGFAAREAQMFVRTQIVADHLASLGLLFNAEL